MKKSRVEYRIFYNPNKQQKKVSARELAQKDIQERLSSLMMETENGRIFDLNAIFRSHQINDGNYILVLDYLFDNLDIIINDQDLYSEWLFQLFSLLIYIYKAELDKKESGEEKNFNSEIEEKILDLLDFLSDNLIQGFMLSFFEYFSVYTAENLPKDEKGEEEFKLALMNLFFVETEVRERNLRLGFRFEASVFQMMDDIFQTIEKGRQNGYKTIINFDDLQRNIFKIISERGW